MTLAETIGMKVAQLPPDWQREVLDFVEFLANRTVPSGPRRDPEGLLADQRSNLSSRTSPPPVRRWPGTSPATSTAGRVRRMSDLLHGGGAFML